MVHSDLSVSYLSGFSTMHPLQGMSEMFLNLQLTMGAWKDFCCQIFYDTKSSQKNANNIEISGIQVKHI